MNPRTAVGLNRKESKGHKEKEISLVAEVRRFTQQVIGIDTFHSGMFFSLRSLRLFQLLNPG